MTCNFFHVATYTTPCDLVFRFTSLRQQHSSPISWGFGRKVKSKTKAGKVIGETIDTWLKKHRPIYICATKHPFILSIGDGTVDLAAFKRWLAQDYIFVRSFVQFVSTVLAKAHEQSDCGEDVEIILGGLAALDDELEWFEKEAAKWGVHFSETVPQQANQDYCEFLESLTIPDVEYTVAMTTFWAIEAVYQESFSHCLEDGSKTPPELKDTCERWGSDGFKQYCNSLKHIANRRLYMATNDILQKSETVFLRVLELEVEFWNMSRGSNLEQLALASQAAGAFIVN